MKAPTESLIFPQELEGKEVIRHSYDPADVGNRAFAINSDALLAVIDMQQKEGRGARFARLLQNHNDGKGKKVSKNHIINVINNSSDTLNKILRLGVIDEGKIKTFEENNDEIIKSLKGTDLYHTYNTIGGLFFLLGF